MASAASWHSLPPEIVDPIFGLLHESDPQDWSGRSLAHLSAARLVCRSWNNLATPHLLRHAIITQHDSSATQWQRLRTIPGFPDVVRSLGVYSAAFGSSSSPASGAASSQSIEEAESSSQQQEQEQEQQKPLIEHIGDASLPRLSSLDIEFGPKCRGVDARPRLGGSRSSSSGGGGGTGVGDKRRTPGLEDMASRFQLLNQVFSEMGRRAERHQEATFRKQQLRLRNLEFGYHHQNQSHDAAAASQNNDNSSSDNKVEEEEESEEPHSPIRHLRIANLQNARPATGDGLGSEELLSRALSTVSSLDLLFTHDDEDKDSFGWHIPQDERLQYIERRTAELYLRNVWLAPEITSRLTSLSLYFRENWGLLPCKFEGRGLSFPALKELNLGRFTLGGAGALDWVVEGAPQLEKLRMEDCCVVSHVALPRWCRDAWKVDTEGWVSRTAAQVVTAANEAAAATSSGYSTDDEADVEEEEDRVFYWGDWSGVRPDEEKIEYWAVPDTWADVCRRLVTQRRRGGGLAKLREFKLHFNEDKVESSAFRNPESMGSGVESCFSMRYVMFSHGREERDVWLDPQVSGMHNPCVEDAEEGDVYLRTWGRVNPHKANYAGDVQALEELRAAIRA